MATLASSVQWGSNPKITCNFSYTKQRSGTTQQYKITVEINPLSGSGYFGYPIYTSITLDGTTAATKTLKAASPSTWTSKITYTTSWLDVTNKTTGTTKLKIRVYSGSGSTRESTYSYDLAVDPAASIVAATDANIDSTSTVTFTRYNSSFTHTLAYKADGQSSYTTIFTKQNLTSYGWKVPSALYALIPNAKTIDVTLKCQTYSGSTLMGETTCKMTATAAESKCAPDITATAEDTNENTIALTGNNKKIIRYHSNVAVTATVTAKNNATISKTNLSCGSDTASGTSYTFADAESGTVKAKTTDSRGYSASASVGGLTLINYTPPTVNATIQRASPTSDTINISVKGNYFSGSFGAVSNTLAVQATYKLPEESSFAAYQSLEITIGNGTYTATGTLTGLDYTKAYDIRVRASDVIHKYGGALAGAVYSNKTIPKGIPVFDWGESDFQFNVPVYIYSKANASPTSQNPVPLRIGSAVSDHIDIDRNDIICKKSPTEASDLYITGNSILLYNKDKSVCVLKIGYDDTGNYIQSMPTYNRTYSATPNVYVSTAGTFGRGTSSSIRYKQDIEDVTDESLDPHAILNIPVRQYRYKPEHKPIDKPEEELYIGFIAEEVAREYPAAAEYNEDGQIEMWSYRALIPAMLKLIQEQHASIESLKSVVKELKGGTE